MVMSEKDETLEEMNARQRREAEENPILAAIRELRAFAKMGHAHADEYTRKADLMEVQYKKLMERGN
jgi:hypothetical protein